MITAKASEGIGEVAVKLEEYGGTYDGIGSLGNIELNLDLSIEEAYALAGELVVAANEARERRIKEISDQLKAGVDGYGMEVSTESSKANLLVAEKRTGPFVLAPARKLTPEEKAERDAKIEREASTLGMRGKEP